MMDVSKDLIYVKSKGKNIISNYIIMKKDKTKPKIYIKNVLIPFGVEKFSGKQIINLEIRPKKDNEHNNAYALLNFFEETVGNKNINNKTLIDEIGNKEYHPTLKESKLGYLIRTNIHSNIEVFAIKNGFKFNTTLDAIKQSICDVEIELGTIWINETQFGYVLGITKIEVLETKIKK